MTGRPHTHPRGFALLIVLWSVVLLALLATGITAAGRSDLQLAGNVRRAAAAEAAADGGIAAAVFHASDTPARAWLADGRAHILPFGPYTLTVRIADESRKVNPNFAPTALLAAVIVASGGDATQAAAVAQSIADWHAPGATEALAAAYRAAGLPAAPPGLPFRSVAELGFVMGMTPELLARLRPHVSVYAIGIVDAAQADPVVRAALRSTGVADPPASPVQPSVLDITCDAQGRDGSRFIRHAVVALGRDQTGRPFRTLLWDALPAG